MGSVSETHVDVRVLSSINVPPYQAIAEGNLRQDLFYRLGVVNITVPPLRERREDIPLLAKQFIMEFNKKLGKNVSNLHLDTLNLFQEYQWPGNVREFQHVIEHAMNIIPADCSVLTPEYIFMPAVQHPPGGKRDTAPGHLSDAEKTRSSRGDLPERSYAECGAGRQSAKSFGPAAAT